MNTPRGLTAGALLAVLALISAASAHGTRKAADRHGLRVGAVSRVDDRDGHRRRHAVAGRDDRRRGCSDAVRRSEQSRTRDPHGKSAHLRDLLRRLQ